MKSDFLASGDAICLATQEAIVDSRVLGIVIGALLFGAVVGCAVLTSVNVVYSGWFGPTNFDECVIEDMKGQVEEMRYVVFRSCEKKFPYEKRLNNDYKELNMEYSWIGDGDSIEISIDENTGDYIITKLRVKFSKKTCIKADGLYGFETDLEKIVRLDGGRFAKINAKNADSFNCMRIEEIYGKFRN